MPLPVDDQVDAVTLGELTVRQRRGQEDPVVPLIVVRDGSHSAGTSPGPLPGILTQPGSGAGLGDDSGDVIAGGKECLVAVSKNEQQTGHGKEEHRCRCGEDLPDVGHDCQCRGYPRTR